MITSLLAVLLISQEHNHPIECASGWPTRCTQALHAGDRGKFDGILHSPDLTVFLAQSSKFCADHTAIEVRTATKTQAAKFEHDKKIMQAEFARDLAVEKANSSAAKMAPVEARSFFEEPIVVALATAAVMALLFKAL